MLDSEKERGWSPWLRKRLVEYKVPNNLNFWYVFGAILLFLFALQIISGIWLAMQYTLTPEAAFSSIQHIMREVPYGWLLRLMHTTGASAFFVAVYLHMYRALIYGSYQKPREWVWLAGMVIYMMLLVEAFTGYVLPWGQVSYWGATVITSFVSAIPLVGKSLVIWLRGDYVVSGVTLHRFFSLHVIAIPLLLTAIIYFHLVFLRQVGANNPTGVDDQKELIPFHPYYTMKDLFGIAVFLLVFCFVLFFMPNLGGLLIDADNAVPANPMQTPADMTPVWYMTPFYAMLCAIPNKVWGLCVMAAAIAVMFVLPWLDRSSVRSMRYKSVYSKIALAIFVISFCGLGYLGHEAISPIKIAIARFLTVGYFSYFLLMPWYTAREVNHHV